MQHATAVSLGCVFAFAAFSCGKPMPAAPPPSANSASESYLAYVKAVQSASKLDDVLPYLCGDMAKPIRAIPEPDKPGNLDYLKKSVPRDPTIEGEDKEGDAVNLRVSGTVTTPTDPNPAKREGKVEMRFEDGAWRTCHSKW